MYTRPIIYLHITYSYTLYLYNSIVNDVIFNNRVTLTDKSALHDSMRSLQTMLNDFLKEYR